MKAKISTNLGTFEFEGSEEFVERQITNVLSMTSQQELSAKSEKTVKASAPSTKQSGVKKSVAQPRMLATLLTSKNEIDSLRNYFTAKNPVTHIEIFATLTLWLRNNKEMKDASVDEMWTLYKILAIRPPKSLIQTFRDGKSKKSFFESAGENGRYFITSYGETFVDHDLPQTTSTKEGK
jgi:hypothetical protein